jgi:hypothetical protein
MLAAENKHFASLDRRSQNVSKVANPVLLNPNAKRVIEQRALADGSTGFGLNIAGE